MGSSLFCFDKGTDSGNIISQFLIANDGLNIAEAKQQGHSLAIYCAQLLPDDGYINWDQPAEIILAQIRSQSLPYPCAFSFCNGMKIKIVAAALYPQKFYGLPGQLVYFEQNSMNPIIACEAEEAIVEELLSDDGVVILANSGLSRNAYTIPS